MPLRHLTPGDYKAMPWRNGRGTTVELAREDDISGAMLWRLSQADVVEPGAFSRFPGVDRILMLVEGEGFDLDFGAHGGAVPVEPWVPVRFSGDWETQACRVRGPSRDLNVMLDRARASAEVAVHRETAFDRALTSRSLFLALRGRTSLRIGSAEHGLSEGELLIASDLKGGLVQGEALGTLVSIDIAIAPRALGL